MNVTTGLVGCVFWVAVAVSQAELTLSNGDFERGISENSTRADVAEWYDHSTDDESFWEGAYQSTALWSSPNGSGIVIFSSEEADDFGQPTPNVNDGSYMYQAIGTADGEESLTLSLEWGSPLDDTGGRELGLTVGVYAYDGPGPFAAADGVDVRGAAGMTLLDSVSFTMTSAGGGFLKAIEPVLDLSGAGGRPLYLRINGYTAGETEAWAVVDNLQIVRSSASVGLLGLFGGGMLFVPLFSRPKNA